MRWTAPAGQVAGWRGGGARHAPLHLGPELRVAPVERLPHAAKARSGARLPLSLSTNWAGLAGTGTGIQGAAGRWVVPAVGASPAAGHSATWVGVDGIGNSDLIQTGTEQDPGGGYFAWWEVLPGAATVITQANGQPEPVAPGDAIEASVHASTSTPGDWKITLQDLTQGWSFTQDVPYSGPGDSAEWIEEAPTVGGAQSVPADFGTVHFSGTSVLTDGPDGTAWYATDLTPANEIALVDPAGTELLAVPTAPAPASPPAGSTGQSFAVAYLSAPAEPTSPRAQTDGAATIRLSWGVPPTSGGAGLAGYRVQLLQGWRIVATETTRMLAVPVRTSSLHGKGWSFRVQAVGVGNQVSRWTLPVRLPAVPAR